MKGKVLVFDALIVDTVCAPVQQNLLGCKLWRYTRIFFSTRWDLMLVRLKLLYSQITFSPFKSRKQRLYGERSFEATVKLSEIMVSVFTFIHMSHFFFFRDPSLSIL